MKKVRVEDVSIGDTVISGYDPESSGYTIEAIEVEMTHGGMVYHHYHKGGCTSAWPGEFFYMEDITNE